MTPPVKYLYITAINKFIIDSGSKTAQENFNKSKEASLGSVALIQMIKNIIKHDFSINQNTCSKHIKTGANIVSPKNIILKYLPNGERYPPKNSIDRNIAFANNKAYSVR